MPLPSKEELDADMRQWYDMLQTQRPKELEKREITVEQVIMKSSELVPPQEIKYVTTVVPVPPPPPTP